MKPIFLSAGIGPWYNQGVSRLARTLSEHGWTGDVNLWQDEWPPLPYPREPVYCVKGAAFEHVMNHGYTTIIWGDASVMAQRPMRAFLDIVENRGWWIGQSGYRASQTAPDATLRYFGVTRDWADEIPDCATGLFGVNLKNEKAREFVTRWIRAGRDGAFAGSRMHANQSSDPRFLFGRQDQAAASIILGMLGMELSPFMQHCRFRWDRDAGQEFLLEGM